MEKRAFLTEEQAQEIIQDVPTPFHVYDEKGIRENARRINKAFSWNKGFKEYFAVKALPNPVILQILKEEGCGVDCSSLTELMLSEACGFTGSDIMFSSNQTPVEDMKKAYELGAYINLDDATMVEFLERVAGVPENIFCRYNPGGTFSLGESEEGFQVMDNPGDAKYGMTEEQMIESYKKLAAKGAKNFGIHAFLASNTISDEYYPELAAILFRYAKQKGYDVSKSADLNGFADANTVSAYATDAMRWAVASGLIQGSNSKLNPKGSATRAQVATILMRYAKL